MSPAKVMLSQKERELVTDAGWILTKNQVIGKVYTLFGNLSENYRQQWAAHPALAGADPGFYSPKISKGEQYRGLPWVILDHPRYFTGTDSFAIRSFFWWGHFFSISLQLSGMPKEKAIPRILERFKELRKQDYYLCIHKNPWQHDLGKKYYRPLKKMKQEEFAELINTKDFIKLTANVKLKKWEKARGEMSELFKGLVELIR